MREFLVLGGTAREGNVRLKEWQYFRKAVVLNIEDGSLNVTRPNVYLSPPEVCPAFPSVLFKAGTLQDDLLYTCTQTEILVYQLPEFSIRYYISLPCFNDLHHVAPTALGTILAAVTGLDLVVELSVEGDVLNEWSVLDQDTWAKFSREIDYRKVPTTQPHEAHPNFVFKLGDEVWTTRCDLNDAICLTHRDRRIDLSGAGFHSVAIVHDGVQYGGNLYFTAVDGNVLIADAETLEVTAVHNLKAFVKTDYPLGWCRGIEILDSERVVVGFSRLRQTKLQDKVRWAKAQVKRVSGTKSYRRSLPSLPTRICCFNLRERTVEWEVPLSEFGVDALFSVHRYDS